MKLSPWKIYTDTAEHFKIHQIIHGFSTGVYNKDEARIKLKNVDLSDKDSFKPNIKQIIDDILKEPIVEKKIISRKRNNVVVNEKIENEIVNIVESIELDYANKKVEIE